MTTIPFSDRVTFITDDSIATAEGEGHRIVGEPAKPAPVPYAWTGDRVTCAAGHEVATVLEPLVHGQAVQPRLHFPYGGVGFAAFCCPCGKSAHRWSPMLSDYQYRIRGTWLPRAEGDQEQ